MKIFVLSKNRVPANVNFCIAYHGFREMGFEVKLFETRGELLGASKQDIVVGYVDTCRFQMERYHVPIEEIDYPLELQKYLGRKIWKSSLNKINSNPDLWPVFIKPLKDKDFTGVAVKSPKDLIGCGDEFDKEIYCSEVVDFLAEWRVFVRYGKILDIRRYKGSYNCIPDYNLMEQAISETTLPNGCAVDFGLTKDGRTLLIEVNDGYALGNYGLFYIDYAKLISARWSQIMGFKDECNF